MHMNKRGSAGLGPDRRLQAALHARYSSDNQREARIASR